MCIGICFLQANASALYVKLFLCYKEINQLTAEKYHTKSTLRMDDMPTTLHATSLNECDIIQYYFENIRVILGLSALCYWHHTPQQT